MAVSNVVVTKTVAGESNQPHRQVLISLDLDASYPAGGYLVPLVGIDNAEGFEIALASAAPITDYRFWWNPSTKRLVVYVLTTGTAAVVGTGVSLAAVTGLLLNCILK
ncbi:hypothetical protein LCGC14_0258900 [marine sediment metagenome]|uniref:Uncharacterized protein n=1 Tax=marine sediment metagenome TaxID=412755 RepID=A0A0F9U2G8_9ZZZZ